MSSAALQRDVVIQLDNDLTRARTIFDMYMGRVSKLARKFEIPGADHDDVRQEALIELWRLAQRLNRGDDSIRSLEATVVFDITRHLGEVCKRQRRLKDLPLLESIRVIRSPSDGELLDILDRIDSPANLLGRDPAVILIGKEFLEELLAGLAALTPRELSALGHATATTRLANGAGKSPDHGRASDARAKLRKHLGLSRPSDRRKERERRLPRVAELRAKGWSVRAIAAQMGVMPNTIARDIQQLDEARVA